ncbi:MAG: MATE family efflux transporter [Firmicutes bacterium]|nr:MATE family efflux transporter [Bacillota bacterium]MDY2596217.1 MATE family efflux transporter [Oliverpabstia sp.]
MNDIMNNRLNQDYNTTQLFRYTFPSILSLVFMAVYQMTDAIFVSNFIGENALASLNIAYPVISVAVAIGLMFSTGGSAITAKKMGQGKTLEAKEDFTCIVLAAFFCGCLISVFCFISFEPLLIFIGAAPSLYKDCADYLGTLLPFLPAAALQMVFSSFFIAAGKPGLGFFLTSLAGAANIILDYVFIVLFHMETRGSALGTAAGYLITALSGLVYFFFFRNGSLYFVRPRLRIKTLAFACFNGSSEMINNLSVAVTTLLFNRLSLKYMGEDGVAAITVVLYAQFFLTSVYMGYIGGAAPLFSFNLGMKNRKRLSSLFRSSLLTVSGITLFVIVISFTLSNYMVSIYIRPNSPVFALARRGFLIFATSYLFAGFNIYTSGLFTALQNGKLSALISILRTFLFLVLFLFLLPLLFEMDGVWMAVPAAEFCSILISGRLLLKYNVTNR